MKLKDVRIGRKLLMAFRVVELLMIALIIMGVTATSSMNGRLEQIVSSNDAMIEAAYDLKGAINSINLRTLGSFASKDEAYRAHMAEVVTENRNKYKSALATLERLDELSELGNDLQNIASQFVI